MAENIPKPKAMSSQPSGLETGATRIRNFSIALVAIALSVAIFFGLRTETNSASLTELASDSTPIEVALSNGQPTLMEFYANWCTSCMAMAPEIKELEQQYAGEVNFVMLNVDNNKWLPELVKYRVDGIPHFVFLGKNGVAIAQSIGEIPRTVLDANLEALVAGLPLPHARSTGQTSAFQTPVMPTKSSATDPRSHSSQVVN